MSERNLSAVDYDNIIKYKSQGEVIQHVSIEHSVAVLEYVASNTAR